VNVRQKRYYLHKESGAHLTGYLGEINSKELKKKKHLKYRSGDVIGKFGAEKAFEDILRGTRGGSQVEVNARGQVVKVLKTVDAIPGQNIYLTIDQILQKKAESLIEEVSAAVVAMDPDNGEILTLASNPSFDPNLFVNGISHKNWNNLLSNPFTPMQNKAIQGQYPPGSTYKIVTAIAGLEERVVNRNTTFYCPGYYEYGDRIFRCWKKSGHGTCNMIRALSQSCDVYFYQVGQRLGVDRLAKYAKGCGLGKRTGIDLDHEQDGLVPTSAWKKKRTGYPWQSGETLSVAIGQGANLPLLRYAGLPNPARIAGFGNPAIASKRVTDLQADVVVHQLVNSSPLLRYAGLPNPARIAGFGNPA
jgi:penicillin-binding protein 2